MVVVKGCVFFKSMLGWVYLKRHISHVYEFFFFLYRHKVCILKLVLVVLQFLKAKERVSLSQNWCFILLACG